MALPSIMKSKLILLTALLLAPLAFVRGEDVAKLGQVSFEVHLLGRDIFQRHCIICHGQHGDGNGEMAKDLPVKPRSFREGWFKFRSTPYDKLPTDDDLRRTIKSGLSGTAMGAFNTFRAEELDAVIAYVKSFSRRWRKQENYAEAIAFPHEPDSATFT